MVNFNGVGKIAKLFQEGAESIAFNRNAQQYATEIADAAFKGSNPTYQEFIDRASSNDYQNYLKHFTGNLKSNPGVSNFEKAVYGAGEMGGRVASVLGGGVNAMGGPVGLAMNGMFMAPMVVSALSQPGQEQQLTPEQIQQLRMQQEQWQ